MERRMNSGEVTTENPAWLDDFLNSNQSSRRKERIRRLENWNRIKKIFVIGAIAVALLITVIPKESNNDGDLIESVRQSQEPVIVVEDPVQQDMLTGDDKAVIIPELDSVAGQADSEADTETNVVPNDTEINFNKHLTNPFNFDPEVWSAIEKTAQEYDLPVPFVNAVVMAESSGNSDARSSDGFNSFGLMQPSLNFHFASFAPYLEQADLLSQITSKSAINLISSDSPAMLANFQNIDPNWKSRQDIESVLCNPEINLQVGCAYLSSLYQEAIKQYPEKSQKEQMLLAAMAYNGGPGAPEEFLSGNDSRYIERIEDYRDKIDSLLNQSI